jgi:hypothetical protein
MRNLGVKPHVDDFGNGSLRGAEHVLHEPPVVPRFGHQNPVPSGGFYRRSLLLTFDCR